MFKVGVKSESVDADRDRFLTRSVGFLHASPFVISHRFVKSHRVGAAIRIPSQSLVL
jgi:hypothetical protein